MRGVKPRLGNYP